MRRFRVVGPIIGNGGFWGEIWEVMMRCKQCEACAQQWMEPDGAKSIRVR